MPAAREPEATYRRRRLAGLLAVLALITLLLNGSQWVEHRRLRDRLAADLGDHLVAVARIAAAGVDGDMLRRWDDWGVDADEADRLRNELTRVREAGSVSNLFLLEPDDPNGRPLLDLTGVVASGEPNPVLALDRAALTRAASGLAAATRLYRTPGGAYLKTGYAPVTADDGEVTGVLGVEGSSSLFAVLDDVRRTLVVVGVGSLIGVIVLGALLLKISESLAAAERELLRAEALAGMGRMAASIAHEIRNPLGIIRATAERLKRRYAPPGGGEPLFDSIPEEVDRLDGILGGYLSFATDRPGELGLLDLRPVVEGTLALARSDLEGAGIAIETRYEVDAAPVLGDAGRLRQVLLNLILNAKQAMPGGGRLEVALRGAGAQRQIPAGGFELAVADNGKGIPPAALSEIWQPFFTSRPGGSGLGLAVVRRIVGEHRGRVWIESEPGKGTSVRVVLPAHRPANDRHAPDDSREARAGGETT